MCLFWTCVCCCARGASTQNIYFVHECAIQGADAAHGPSRPTQHSAEHSYRSTCCVVSSTKRHACSNRSLEMRTISYSTMVWVDGWVVVLETVRCFFLVGKGVAAERLVICSSSDLSAFVTSSLCCLHPQDWFRAAHT